jgi:cobyrinic acid a,c-diamide synthase
MNDLWESARTGRVCLDQIRLWICRSVIVGVLMLAMTTSHMGTAIADERQDVLTVLQDYLTAVYARDYATAYQWLSEADRRQQSLAQYEQDNQPFKGASLALAQRLAKEIVIREAVVERQGDRATVQTTLGLPNGNAEEVSRLLLAPGGFEEAPRAELEERMAKLDALIASGQLPRLDSEDTWTLVRDPAGWRILLAGGTP